MIFRARRELDIIWTSLAAEKSGEGGARLTLTQLVSGISKIKIMSF